MGKDLALCKGGAGLFWAELKAITILRTADVQPVLWHTKAGSQPSGHGPYK